MFPCCSEQVLGFQLERTPALKAIEGWLERSRYLTFDATALENHIREGEALLAALGIQPPTKKEAP